MMSTSYTSPMLKLMSDPERSTLFKQGAEAKVYTSQLFPAPLITTLSNEATSATAKPTVGLLKYRFPKTYRHQTLSSQLTASRTTAEARALVRCAKAGVNTPGILCVDDSEGVLGLELIEGHSVRQLLGGGSESDEIGSGTEEDDGGETEIIGDGEAMNLMSLIGIQLAKMHQVHVIHGDLTTSNMMVKRGETNELTVVSSIHLTADRTKGGILASC
jgi:TP53 regulating kinase-like protein